MAFPRGRQEPRRSSSFYIISGAVFVAALLIGVWVYSSPAPVREESRVSSATSKDASSSFDESASDNTVVDESPNTSKSDEALDEPADKETLTTGTTETTSNESDASQGNESDEEKEASEDTPSDDATSTTTDSASPVSEEEKIIEDQQDQATTPAVIESEVGKNHDEKFKWKLCDWESSQDYIPCLDNKKWLDTHRRHKHYEHRERHCPSEEELPKCLVPIPAGYKPHVKWPESRDQIWYNNVPHTGLVSYKADQQWVKKAGDKLVFPGGGTQFMQGAGHYIDFVQKIYPAIEWGKHTRVLLDVGCGVASFGGYLYDRNVLAMSFAPKDEHEAQVQFALERGIPAFSSVMGTQRLVFPSNSFDGVHCARCRVPWHVDGGLLLLELNRVLRPGGLFLWSATPVYQDLEEDVQIWKETTALAKDMGWEMVAKEFDEVSRVGVAIFKKPENNTAYEKREGDVPEICPEDNKPNAAWYVNMTTCLHKIPDTKRTEWPEEWPLRVKVAPKWLSEKDTGIYGKAAPEDFRVDTEHWNNVVNKTYLTGLGMDWTTIRNVMDMRAGYGGFAAALIDQPVWVLNVIPSDEPDTLPIVYDRGLIGMYHDWCEPHSTYPRTYDLLHANHVVSSVESVAS
uniref:Methyltransferase n=1 Tax=Physcomitrium patens TaxID=3218 RepID=A0A7I4DJH1_PHYPA